MIVVLIPLGVWTIFGLVALWPSNVSEHIAQDLAGYSVPGVTYPSSKVVNITEISCQGLNGSTSELGDQTCADVGAELLEGEEKGQTVIVSLNDAIFSSGVEIGTKIKLVRVPPTDGNPAQYQFSDFERGIPLLVISLVFAGLVIAVARWRGFASLLGLVFAGFIIVKFMFPALISSSNPILVGLVGSSAIMFVVLYAAHGFSTRTTTALLGTLFGLMITASLAYAATRWAHLTGISAEDDFVLAAAAPDMRLTSVVMCAIIVAGLGVLNDVTITQASAVWELADSPQTSQRRLFARAMRIGRDHVASTVYTIAFATVGASMPVLLLITIYDRPALDVVMTEQFATEIIRTLVGSIGLVLAMPLTTAIGVAVVRAGGRGQDKSPHRHPESLETAGSDDKSEAAAQTTASEATAESSARLGMPRKASVERASGTGAAVDLSEPPDDEMTQIRRPRGRRRQKQDDFGDFSNLRDPDD